MYGFVNLIDRFYWISYARVNFQLIPAWLRIGDGTNEAIRRGAMASSVCILILASLVSWHYIKKHLEKADDEFQISKNLREALNYYANNLYKENSLTII